MNALRSFVLLLSVLALTGCAPKVLMKESISLKQYYDSEYHSTNRLVAFQTGLSLPDGWTFSKPLEKDYETVVFRFDDGEGFIKGLYQYFRTDVEDISPLKLARHMALTEEDKYDKSLHKVYVDSKEAYLVTSKQRETDLDFFDCYIVEGSNYNLIRLYSEPGYLFKNPEVAYKVFFSYKFEKKGVNIRFSSTLPGFQCLDGNWRWYDDYSSSGEKLKSPGGYGLVTTQDSPYRCFLAVEASTHSDVRKHLAQFYSLNQSSYDVEKFDTPVTFAGKEFEAEGIGRTADEYGYAELALILNNNGENIFLRIRGKREDFDLEDAEDLLSEEFIVNSLSGNFSFQ
ncbi:MAG: hypothetical protein ACLFVQ_10565 [Chitinispirillaceae bacterium]